MFDLIVINDFGLARKAFAGGNIGETGAKKDRTMFPGEQDGGR
jgi:hypothetical protein